MAYGRGAAAVKAIEDVSLEIARGEFIAVVGPSGCGKSSLMKLISGLHPPASGVALVDGKHVDGPLTGRPSTVSEPAAGGCSPEISFISELLPQPEGPTTAMNSPRAMSSVTSSMARTAAAPRP